MKIFLAFIGALIAVGVYAQTATGEITRRQVRRTGPIIVSVNGRNVAFPDTTPQMFGDRVMVPLRGVFERMNAVVKWDANLRRVVATRGDRRVVLEIGNANASIDGTSVVMDSQPVIYNNRTLVPLRFLAESLKAGVVWRPEERHVVVTVHGLEAPFKPDGGKS